MGDLEQATKLLRVGSDADVQKVASTVAHAIYDDERVVLRAIGAGAVNQAIKSVAIARGYVAQRGFDLVCVPGFENVTGRDGKELSAMTFQVRVAH